MAETLRDLVVSLSLQLTLAVEGVNALLLEVAFYAMLFELADGGQAVHGVSGEAADGLGHDQVYFARLFDTM